MKTDRLEILAERLKSAFSMGAIDLDPEVGGDLGNHVDELTHIEWKFRRASLSPARWGAHYYAKRSLKVTGPSKKSFLASFSPAIESLPFTAECPPVPQLIRWQRSSPGSVRLADPHKRTGSSYAFRLHFDPPLRRGDEAEFEFEIDFPEYRLGTREEFVLAQLDHGHAGEIRDFQHTSRTISQPTRRLFYQVALPHSLKAVPIDPEVTRYDTLFNDEQAFLMDHSDVYSVRDEEVDGDPSWVMRIDRSSPPFKATYRMRWTLPSKKDLRLGDD